MRRRDLSRDCSFAGVWGPIRRASWIETKSEDQRKEVAKN
jgi:hypothetical protein